MKNPDVRSPQTARNARSRPAALFLAIVIAVPVYRVNADGAEPTKAKVPSYKPAGIRIFKNRGKPATFKLVSKPANGTVEMPVWKAGRRFFYARYISKKDFVGKDSFSWTYTMGSMDSKPQTVSINVVRVAPIPAATTMEHVVQGSSTQFDARYSGGGGYSYKIETGQPRHGTVKLTGTRFVYKPKPGFTGVDSFSWHFSYPGTRGRRAKSRVAEAVLVVKKRGMTDWTQWRADGWRSGFTTMTLPSKLHLQWRRDMPTVRGAFGTMVHADIDFSRPVQLGKIIFVPVPASDCLMACNTDTGKLLWRFYASGAVRRPPVAMSLAGGVRVVILSSDDGWVYALNAADGKVRWKFRAAPNNRKCMGFGRLSSAWPIWASSVGHNGKVYMVAGYIASFGLYAYCLDAATGSVEWVNDGRKLDLWDSSTLGPLALSFDNKRVFGSTNNATTPWVLDAATGAYLGHVEVGFTYPGRGKKVKRRYRTNDHITWYVDGRGIYDHPEPMTITAGSRVITPKSLTKLGLTGTVASMLAGDAKIFVTTAEGSLYCFGEKQVKPVTHARKTTPLPEVADSWSAAAKAMLAKVPGKTKSGLALVLGVKDGRLVEELAKRSSLTVVAVDSERERLQALRVRMDAAGLPAARVSTLQGDPMDFAFAPYQAVLITSEDVKRAGLAGGQRTVEKLYRWARPFGGEVWLPTSGAQHATLKDLHGRSKNVPLSEITREGQFSRMARKGLPDHALRVKPPFGLVAFDSQNVSRWTPMYARGPGRVPTPPANNHVHSKGYGKKKWGKGYTYPTVENVSTADSVFTSMVNPLYSLREKFSGLPCSGNEGGCGAGAPGRYGDICRTQGKIATLFDASSHYWGRLFMPESGSCVATTIIRNGMVGLNNVDRRGRSPEPSSAHIFCGCTVSLANTGIVLAPMKGEETWVAYRTTRTSQPVEELPIRRVGINLGAPGDRLAEDGTLWTHHPFAGRYGRWSYNRSSSVEALPLVPVSYRGPVGSTYRHSAQMKKTGSRYRGWVAASYVRGMSSIEIPLAQPAVALQAPAAPKIDGQLGDACWDGKRRLFFTPNTLGLDPSRRHGPPPTADECFAMLRHDEANLYVAAGAQARYGPGGRKYLTVTLNSRERTVADIVLTCAGTKRSSKGIDVKAWSGACMSTKTSPFAAEMAIPWKALAAAGLWKDQLVINIDVSASRLIGAYTPRRLPQFKGFDWVGPTKYTPLYLDSPRGEVTRARPYTVRLYFAEMEGKKPGQRLFNVKLQGKPVLTKFDVAKEAGGPKRELVKEFKNIGISDKLRIAFAARVGEAMLSGVEIIGTYPVSRRTRNALPVAEIKASTVAGAAPLAVVFSAQKSRDLDGQIVECAWETGDGRLARGSLLRHVFAEPGTYQVHLLVRDNRGGMAAKSVTVKVTAGKPAAFVCRIRAKGGDYATLSAWEAAMRSDLTAKGKSLLFAVKKRGRYVPTDDGKVVRFTGGGKGRLRHLNASGVAYVTGCSGTIRPGTVTCASGNKFEVAAPGQPVYALVAECHNDWPNGLVDKVVAGAEWKTDAIRSVTIRSAAGQGHTGRPRDKRGSYTGFAFKGDLDLKGIPHARIQRLIVDPAGTLSTGSGASISRVLAGPVSLRKGGMIANSVGSTLSVAGPPGVVRRHPSVYRISIKEAAYRRFWIPKYEPDSNVRFINCTAATFDPGNRPNVAFINCLAAPGGKGFVNKRYVDPAYAIHCVSTDSSATVWDSGDGHERNAANQKVALGADYHLTKADKGARGRGGPALGADIDGKARKGPKYDVGADSATP
jgi:outer membrane protein assembly factor BamB/PKD repeat protein